MTNDNTTITENKTEKNTDINQKNLKNSLL